MTQLIRFSQSEQLADLTNFLQRAERLDKDGIARLRAFGDVLTVFVAPIYSGSVLDSGPTVVGVRSTALADTIELDQLVSISSLLRGMREQSSFQSLEVLLNSSNSRAVWAGTLPPITGWLPVGEISEPTLSRAAKSGIESVKSALPESVGSALAAKLRLSIWGQPLALDESDSFEGELPAAAAFAAAGLGLLTRAERVKVFQLGRWFRLTALHGHVLSRAVGNSQPIQSAS
jgi:hypothetical protein